MSNRDREREAEFIANWNEMVNLKLDEQNLRQPSFNFFYNALESLLQSLNYDIDRLKSEFTSNDAERLYYIKFCAYIDSVYQLSGSNNNFYYFDLVNPVPKKCFHVLKTLLNYLIYYEMVKKEVCTKANEFLTAYDDALEEHTELLKKNKGIETRAAEIKYQLSEYEKALPSLQQEVSQMTAQKEENEKAVRELNDAIKEYDRVIIKTDVKLAEMSENIITEDEYKKGIEKLNLLKSELHQLKGIAEHARTSNVGSNAQVDALSKMVSAMSNILETQKLSSYEELIESQSELTLKSKETIAFEQKIDELTANIQSLNDDIERCVTEAKQKESHLKSMQKEFEQKQADLKRANVTKSKEIDEAKADLLLLQANVDELAEQQRFLMSTILEIVERSARPFMKGP